MPDGPVPIRPLGRLSPSLSPHRSGVRASAALSGYVRSPRYGFYDGLGTVDEARLAKYIPRNEVRRDYARDNGSDDDTDGDGEGSPALSLRPQ